MESCGIILDRDVIESRCKSILKPRDLNDEMFSYLEANPRLGIITSITDNYVKGKLWDPKKKRKNTYKQMVCEYERMKEICKIEKINYGEFLLKLDKVNTFFDNLVGQNQTFYFQNKYEKMIRPQRKENTKFSINDGYRKSLAEVVCVRPRYDKLLFISNNPKFSHPFILNAIEERFDITGGNGELILREIKKLTRNEYLCNIESIS